MTVIVVSVITVSGGLFFFFKQKTAYEMRISDWSSDVCSSDLPSCGPPPANQPLAIGGPGGHRCARFGHEGTNDAATDFAGLLCSGRRSRPIACCLGTPDRRCAAGAAVSARRRPHRATRLPRPPYLWHNRRPSRLFPRIFPIRD